MSQNKSVHYNGVLIPTALTMHQPSLASQIANNPPIIEKSTIINISSEINMLRLNKEIITIPEKTEKIPIVKRNNLPLASMLHSLSMILDPIPDILMTV